MKKKIIFSSVIIATLAIVAVLVQTFISVSEENARKQQLAEDIARVQQQAAAKTARVKNDDSEACTAIAELQSKVNKKNITDLVPWYKIQISRKNGEIDWVPSNVMEKLDAHIRSLEFLSAIGAYQSSINNVLKSDLELTNACEELRNK